MAITPSLIKGEGQCIMHLNAQSIRNKFDILKKELHGQGIGVLLFSETWLTEMNSDIDYHIDDYNLFRWDRQRQMNAGGLCAFIDQNLTCSNTVYQELNKSDVNIEIQWLKISNGKNKKMLIGNVYRPPNGDKNVFINELRQMLSNIQNVENMDIIITGDFNIDVIPESNTKNRLYSSMDDFGLKQLIHEPTRNKMSTTCIDLIFTNIHDISSSGVALLNTSDHLPVYLTIKRLKPKCEPRVFIGRSYKNYDTQIFSNKFRDLLWNEFDDSEDVNYLWDIFEHNINKILDVMCPIKNFKIRYKEEPWLTPELTAQIIEKNLALKKAKKSNRILDWEASNQLKNLCCTAVKQAKQTFVVDEIKRNAKDSKKFWAAMRSIVPSKKGKSKLINLVDDDKNEVEKDKVSEYINSFFTGIGPKLAEKHKSTWSFEGQPCEHEMPAMEFLESDVLKVINDINISKSSSLKHVSSKVFKDAVLSMPTRFTRILNLAFKNSNIPNKWKIATVTPLPKSGDLTNVSNYRPISQLPIPGKILERLIHNNISQHLENNNILTEIQGGYRKSCSTLDTISKLTNDILRERNSGRATMAAFIDTKKAFDCVNYSILFEKLNKYGIKNLNLKC